MSCKDTVKAINDMSAKFRSKPFWALNGELEWDEMKRQIDTFKKMGFGGFFLHSRTGLITEYLGEKWFDLIRKSSQYAYSIGLESWLYDEDRWPSGTAGGIVTKNEQYRMRYISLYHSEQPQLPVLARFAVKADYKISGIAKDSYFKVNSERQVPKGYKYCIFCIETMSCGGFYNGFSYVDTMNIDATNAFIAATHEKYRENCGDLFGNAIKGIFTDEPYRGAMFTGFSVNNSNRYNMCPYTDALPQEYFNVWKENIIDILPQLYFGNHFNVTAYRYIEVLQRLFLRNFAQPCYQWCKENNLLLTGHILHEDSLSAQASLSGSVMRYYEHMDIPGLDILANDNDCFWVAKQCESAARQTGKEGVLSELYGASGWEMGLNEYKRMGDWQTLYGVTLRCPHLSWYTMKGEAKRDYPASINVQSSLCGEMKYLEDYFARFSTLVAVTKPVISLGVINSVERIWGCVKNDWMEIFTAHEPHVSGIDNEYFKQFEDLRSAHIDFDYIEEDMLERIGTVESFNGTAVLKVGLIAYKQILYSFNSCRPRVQRLIEEFRQAGGKVINSTIDAVPEIAISAEPKITARLFLDDDGYWLVCLNLTKNNLDKTEISIALPGLNAREFDIRQGIFTGACCNSNIISTKFYAGQERVWRLDKTSCLNITEQNAEEYIFEGTYPFSLSEDNILPLDQVKCNYLGENLYNGNVLLCDKTLRNKLGIEVRGGESVQPWYKLKYGKDSDKSYGKVILEYSFEVEKLPSSLRLACEEGWKIRVNGKLVKRVKRRWADICFKVYDIIHSVKTGENLIELSCDFTENINMEAIYVLGDFGVKVPKCLTALPEKLTVNKLKDSGLPYYSGKINFYTDKIGKINVSANKTPNIGAIIARSGKRSVNLSFTPFMGYIDALEPLVMELTLTRRNTFGPLHLKKALQSAYGPDSFIPSAEDELSINVIE